jgi:uncharacterized protein (DUF58 family)
MANDRFGGLGGLGRWLRATRRMPLPELPTTPAKPKPDRGLLERKPAPRGQDALHDKGWRAQFNWFGPEIEPSRQSLAQRAAEVLAGLGPLQLPVRQVADGQPGGLHRSLRRGGGVEFSEHKEYAPGDDLRHLDWKAYARTDRYFVKRYEQEVHATLTLVLDASASMQFHDLRGGDKFDTVRLLFAALALVLVRQGDAVGLVVVGRPELNLAAHAGVRQFTQLCERLESCTPAGQAGLDQLGPASWRGLDLNGIAVVASDVLVQPELAVAPLRDLQRAGMDVLLLHTLHPRERDLDFGGPTTLACPETGDRRLVDPRLARADFVGLMHAHCERLRTLATHSGLGYLPVDTSIEARGLTRQVLRATARLRRRGHAEVGAGAYGEEGFDADVLLVEEG